jgi:hypothetical protein
MAIGVFCTLPQVGFPMDEPLADLGCPCHETIRACLRCGMEQARQHEKRNHGRFHPSAFISTGMATHLQPSTPYPSMKSLFLTLIPTLLLAAGCAHVKVKRVAPDAVVDGIPFLEPQPYLLVSKIVKPSVDGQPSTEEYTNQIIYLPNPSRRYAIQVKPGWGTVDGSVNLIDGWRLDSFGAKSDSKGPETIGAFAGLLKEAAAVAATVKPDDSREGLYLIRIAPDGTLRLEKQRNWL